MRHVPSPRLRERLRQVGDDVVDVLDADGEAHVIVGDAGRELVLGESCECVVAGRMDRQRARIADVGHVVEQLERIDEARARLRAALQLEADQPAEAALQIVLGAALLLALEQARVDRPW